MGRDSYIKYIDKDNIKYKGVIGLIQVCYKVKDKIFNDGELVAVRWKDPFSDKIVDYVGRIIPSTLVGELRLDISTRYNSHIIDITLKEIININEVGGVS